MMKKILFFTFAFLFTVIVNAQIFNPLGGGNIIPSVTYGHISWADIDNDGDLDFFIMGEDENYNNISKIFENKVNEGKFFVERTDLIIQGLTEGWSDWGDFDKDGDPDLLIAGSKTYTTHATLVYENKINQGLGFVERTDIALTPVYDCKVEWYDFNRDGYLDIILNGKNSSYQFVFEEWENDKTGKFFYNWHSVDPDGYTGYSDFDKDGDVDMFITYYYSSESMNWADGYMYSSGNYIYVGDSVYFRGTKGQINFADFNNDGYEDVIVTGGNDEFLTRVYQNKPNEYKKFVRDSLSAFKQLKNGRAEWADMDKDGDLDLLLSGQTTSGYVTGLIYRNDGNVFTEMSSLINLGYEDSYATWADFNNDTYPDIVLTGEDGYTHFIKFFVNKYNPSPKTYAFSEFQGYPSGNYKNGFMAWGDVNNDNYQDLFVSGTISWNETAKLYINNSAASGDFSEYVSGITGLEYGDANWFDFDNDGDLDLFITGSKSYNPNTKLYINKMNESLGFVEYTDYTFKKLYHSSVDFGDYDNDGDYDIIVTGMDDSYSSITIVYENTYNIDKKFIEHTDYGLINVSYGIGKLTDINNDGFLDILLLDNNYFGIYYNQLPASKSFYHALEANYFDSGYEYSANSELGLADYDQDGDMDMIVSVYQTNKADMFIYKNDLNNSNSIVFETSFSIPAFKKTAFAWGDIDNDGDLDLAVSGEYENNLKTKIYENRLLQSQGFVEKTEENLPGYNEGKMTFIDFDNDNDLDLAIIGNNDTEGLLLLAKNNTSVKNTAPTAPTNLAYKLYNKGIVLSWNASTDAQTKSEGLTYNLKVGKTSGAIDIMSPNSVTTTLNNGKRKITSLGNVEFGTSAIIKDLPYGTYYWAVQSIDNSYAGSSFSSEAVFTVQPDATFETNKTSLCLNDTLTVEFKGYYYKASNVTFNWNFGGATIISGTGEGPYKVKWNIAGSKTISLTISESGKTSSQVQKNVSVKDIPQIELGNNITACKGANITLTPIINGSTTDLLYKWNTGQTTKSIVVTQDSYYYITVTNSDNCSALDSVKVNISNPYDKQEICVVTVDSGKNLIAWERVKNKGIKSFKIYKETSTAGQYNLLATVPFNNTSVYVDQTSVPETRSERYKISVVDTCDNESPMSSAHKTMHLTINIGVNDAFNLIWDNYEGTEFYSYIVYRGTSKDNLVPIDTIPNNIMTYTDNPKQEGTYYYQIVVKLPTICAPANLKASSGPFSQAVSNMEKKLKGTGIDNELISYFSLYPNPSNGKIFINSHGQDLDNVQILDATGKIVYLIKHINGKEMIDLSSLSNGIYLLKANNKQNTLINRFVIIK
jgi:hypothetical protein